MRVKLMRERVYDPILRLIHLWLALCVTLLLLSSQVAQWLALSAEAAVLWRLHAWVGYGLLLGLVARLTWALYGPHHAHWRQFWTWRAWLAALRSRSLFTPPGRFGHHPLATAVYLLFYLLALAMTLTGLALMAIDQGHGPLLPWLGHDLLVQAWFRGPHDIIADVLLVFVLAHLAALILHERLHGIPLAQSMVSGYQYREDDAP